MSLRLASLLWPLLTSGPPPSLQHSLAPSPPVTSQTSPGKLSHFRMISGVSTQPLQQLQPSVSCATSTRQLCLSIRFLSVCTIPCSPAYFRPRLAANALAACYAATLPKRGKNFPLSPTLFPLYFACLPIRPSLTCCCLRSGTTRVACQILPANSNFKQPLHLLCVLWGMSFFKILHMMPLS